MALIFLQVTAFDKTY